MMKISRLAACALTLSAALRCTCAVADGSVSATMLMPRVAHKPLPRHVLADRAQSLLQRSSVLFVGESWYVSPAKPFLPDKAYLRASAGTTGIVMDAYADALMTNLRVPQARLQVFVHGSVGKATVVDCAIDGATTLETSVQLGKDAGLLNPDPQRRRWTTLGLNGHFTFVVPADVPLLSATNWFALELAASGPHPGGGVQETTLYGCSISLVK